MVTDRQTMQEDTSGVLEPDIREKLRRSGYTLTSQRRAVLEALSEAKGHPSAEDIYLIVKRKNPRVALGTVYQALSVLEEVGVIGSKHWAESPTRYDLNVEPHLDIRCIRCGEVSEVQASPWAAWKSASATTLLTGLPARRWSSRACARPAWKASQLVSISALQLLHGSRVFTVGSPGVTLSANVVLWVTQERRS